MAQNLSVTTLMALTGAQIRAFNRDQTLKYQGLAMILTQQQLAICQKPLKFLEEHLAHLDLQQTHRVTQETANARQITIDQQNQIIRNNAISKKCWACYFLEKGRADTLITTLFFTIIISLITNWLAFVQTEKQIASKNKTMYALGSIGIIIIILLFIWGLARKYYLQHQHN